MRKQIMLYFTAILIFAACGKSEQLLVDEVEKEGDTDQGDSVLVKFKLSATPDVGNILSMVNFQIEPDVDVFLSDIKKSVDSIDWHVEGLEGKFPIFRVSPNSTNLTTNWGHYFYVPADYKSYILAYKEGKIVFSDTVETKIRDERDFLSLNWKDISTNSYISTGYIDALLGDSWLTTSRRIDERGPFVYVTYLPSRLEKETVEKSKRYLHDYMTVLYGEPKWTINTPEIETKFKDLFKHQQNGYSVSAIWITAKSKLALITDGTDDKKRDYKILAEPI